MSIQTPVVKLERMTDGVAVITIDNPPVNALTTPVFAHLSAIADELTTDPPKAVVLTGRTKVFALGGEISETYRTRFRNRDDFGDAELDAAVAAATEPGYVKELGEKYLRTFNAVAALPCMVIAAIQGIAYGGGVELALACDYRVASDRAELASPEVTLGGGTVGGGVFRMARLVGPAMAKKMYMGGAAVSVREALRIGLVDEVVPGVETFERAMQLARSFAAYAGPAQAGLKRIIDAGYDMSTEEADRMELETWCASYATDHARRSLRHFFAHGPADASPPKRS
ncbi:enoyl-CoA hydratase/isomerase family protein [Nocardia zapadnayensis]|uniref:enoyl-CoA hydratase/isomerase family protein n=1 Tax=Nocardia rhamnosiphila TaxID=426716 RepID=UPI00224851B2|nr:enoyl-CoA hydratase/isomerase family protein [Nocardia zapadnayensis]MCX0272867.1 enoyl-CoA hydratase/isomerase family protein [Nocardia zapadnayensis]